MPHSVLVTGSNGALGRATCAELQRHGHRVRGFDRVSAPDLDDQIIADLVDRDAVARAVAGMDTVIHFAATPDEADFIEHLIEPNVRGLFHVCDAARQAGVRRLVLASSAQVINGHFSGDNRSGARSNLITPHDAPKPVNHYALTKQWAEDLGDMYARIYNLSVILVRIGWCVRAQHVVDELRAAPRGTDVYLSNDDAGRFFRRCVEAEQPAPGTSAILFATSRPANRPLLDIEPAKQLIGYEPRDTWPEGMPFQAE